MRFDPLSFVVGFGAASGLSALAWLSRRRLARVQDSAGERISLTRQMFGQAGDLRYRRDLIACLQQQHCASPIAPLSAVLIEPHLVSAPAPVMPVIEGSVEARDIFEVVPRIHALPYSYAPYNVETLNLTDLLLGDPHVAILGMPGLGKSTALATLALMALGAVSFTSLEDLTAQTIRAEEEGLTDAERKQRAREREMMQERALEKLHEAEERRREMFIVSAEKQLEARPRVSVTDLVPILVDLRDLELNPALYGGDKRPPDPAEPLVRAAQRQMSGLTAQFVGTVLYPVLEAGQALVLLDGYDDLSPAARESYYFWLQQFIAAYGKNRMIITGPAEGYAPLVTLGFTPTFLRAWVEGEYAQLVRRWGEAWAARTGQPVAPETLQRLTVDNRARSMLDVTLKIWAGLAGDVQEIGRFGWYDALVTRRLSNPALRELLPALAAALIEAQQPISRAELLNVIRQASAGKAIKSEDVLDVLVQDGVLRRFAADRFGPAQVPVAEFLASMTLVQAGSARAAEVAMEPAWQGVLAFAAAKLDLLPAIQKRMDMVPDLLYSTLFGIVRWVPDAPPDAPWRGELFRRLGAAMLAQEQYPGVRERAMAAMIAAREPNVLFVFRQALRSANPDVRRIGCIGMGALGSDDALNDLAGMMADPAREVKLAAALALGAIGSEKAIEIMIHGLFQGENELRRAIAEALAAIPGEGHNTLREAIAASEIEIRRAAVYGLSRVRSPWALTALYRTMFQDEQWYVRSAAEEAFLTAQSPDREGPHAHPEADTLAWLGQWAEEHGQVIPAGEASRQMLIRVLQESSAPFKVLAAQTLGRLGHVPALKPLYSALRDRDPEVRGAAYAALSQIQMRLGEPLPGLV